MEYFRDKCGGVETWINKQGYYVVLIEGWALYSENPVLSDDVNLYKDNIMQKYGMFKWQVCVMNYYGASPIHTSCCCRAEPLIIRSGIRIVFSNFGS